MAAIPSVASSGGAAMRVNPWEDSLSRSGGSVFVKVRHGGSIWESGSTLERIPSESSMSSSSSIDSPTTSGGVFREKDISWWSILRRRSSALGYWICKNYC